MIMIARGVTPILNVSDLQQSFAWFEKLGWRKGWDWGDPPGFGAVCSGECEIFLCLNGQGGRGRGTHEVTFGADGDEEGDKGVWMSLWVDDVDAIHRLCLERGLEITWPPTDMPWNVREMHVRHPDGHVFRISRSLEEQQGKEREVWITPLAGGANATRQYFAAGLVDEMEFHLVPTLLGAGARLQVTHLKFARR